MAAINKIRGQIVIKLMDSGEPELEFTGKLDVIDIQSAVYNMRTQFQFKYLDGIGAELKKKAEAKAVELAKALEVPKVKEEAKKVEPVVPVATNTKDVK